MKIVCHKLVSLHHTGGSSIKDHTHKHHELVYCTEGSGWAQIEEIKSDFSGGNYYITRAGTVHTETDNADTRIVYFYFDAPVELVTEGMFCDYDGSVLSCVKKLRTESESEDVFKDKMIECLITRILIEAMRSGDSVKEKDGIRAVLKYLDENIENHIDFRALAKQQHYSFDRFRHLFKEYTGVSPHRYVINARIEKAKFLLKLNPSLSLTEISFYCGFSSSSHFTKAFRTVVGMTPSEYLKKRTENRS